MQYYSCMYFAPSLLCISFLLFLPFSHTTAFFKLCAKCRTATEPLSVEELMRACDLCEEEEEMVLELLRDLTKVRRLILESY